LNPSLPLNGNLLNLALTMSYPFDFWNKYRNMFAAALGIVKAQQAEEKQVELLITTALAEAYFSLAINLEKKTLYEKLLSLQTKLANLDDLLKVSGLDSNFPVYSSIETREDAKKMVLGIEDEIAINRHLINALIGKSPNANIEVLFLSKAPKKLSVPENISLNLVAKRPDLMAAVWRMESLSHEVGAKVADFFPDVTLQALFGLQTLQPSKFFTNQATTFSVTPAFNLPIFTAGYIRAGVDEKKAEFEEAVREYNRLVLEAAKEVSNKLVSLQTFYEQKMSQQVIVENAQLRLSLRKARVDSGLDNLLDLYHEEIALIHRELQNLDLLFGQYYSVVELIKSLGGGYDDQTS